ncbi:MAG: protein kinase [Candidatus Omnitrophica bacterium]|nr:protein kinase [Candidatus Omnitrophota bacterium]
MKVRIKQGDVIGARYQVMQSLGEGSMNLVYRIRHLESSTELAAKFLKPGVISSYIEDRLRFKREIEVVSTFDHPNIARIYDGGEHQGAPYVVMDIYSGEDLFSLIQKQTHFEFETIIGIINQVAQALSYVHSRGVIHGDLKAGNIIIKRENEFCLVKLLDFGIAKVMELTKIKSAQDVLGTFSYMSPEQSGIVKKTIDERSDLYSLGIIFYQLLTGELPFAGEDVGEILHQQIAREPMPPSSINRQISPIIEKIILKLLKKDPKERYQTASGLMADINRHLKGEVNFALGKDDRAQKITYRTSLIGREEELNQLKQLYDQTREGQGAVCFIAGEAGRGKTRLLEELKGYVYEQGGEFFSGKCFAQENKIPYQAFREILDEYLRMVDKLIPKEKKRRLSLMQESVGELGEVIRRFNPAMEEILPQVPALVPLDSERENRRFLMVCSQFFQKLGELSRPIVMVLDDLQWADEGTFALLSEILEDINKFPVLILGSYRDNEIDPAHSLTTIIRESRKKQTTFKEIALNNFDLPRLSSFVSALLLEESGADELSRYIYDMSKGNPFFTIEILRQLENEKVITFAKGQWAINRAKLKAIAIPTTIIDILLKRIGTLREEQIEILSAAAIIGRKFKLKFLSILIEKPLEDLVTLIDEAMVTQLLERSSERGEILFVHDRIKDAFYAKIGKAERTHLHLKIAKAIEQLNPDSVERVLFDLAHHYIRAGAKDKSLQYSLPAAKKAQDNYANKEAIDYYEIVIRILEKKNKKGNPEWTKAKKGLVEIYLTIGRKDAAIEICQQLSPLEERILEKAKLYRQIGTAYFKKGDWKNCEDNLCHGLTLLGEKSPQNQIQVTLFLIKELFVHILHCLFPKFFHCREIDPAKAENLEKLWAYHNLYWVYILFDVKKFVWSVLRCLNFSEVKVGRIKERGICSGAYAALCMAIPLFKRAIKYHNKGITLCRELGDDWGVAQCLQWKGYCYLWKGDYQKSIEIFSQSYDQFRKMGDIWELGMVLLGLGFNHFYSSNYEKALSSFHEYLDIAKRTKDDFGITSAQQILAISYAEKGDYDKAEELCASALSLIEEKNLLFGCCVALNGIAHLKMEKVEWSEAKKYLKRSKKLYEENNFLKDYAINLYPYLAEVRLEEFKARQVETFGHQKELEAIRKACKQALKLTKPWANHHGGALRVMAKYYAFTNYKTAAQHYFLKSIKHCKDIKRRYELACGYYEYGIFLSDDNKLEEAKINYRKAYEIFKNIGAQGRVSRCANLPGCGEEKEPVEEITPQVRLRMEREMETVLDTSQYLSSILNLDELLERIIDKTVELVGAERAAILLYPDRKEVVEHKLEVTVARNIIRGGAGDGFPNIGKSIISEVEKTKKLLAVNDLAGDQRFKNQPNLVKLGIKSVLCAPLMARGDMLGVIYLDSRLVSGLFSREDLRALSLISSQAGISIENAKLYKQAVFAESSLRQSEKELRQHRDNLEEMVKERTVSLIETNRQLQGETAEKLKMQQELLKTQKLESLGVLAGGIAHDFNNILAAILCNINLSQIAVPSENEAVVALAEAEKAIQRARSLTQQLLIFSKGGAPIKKLASIADLLKETSEFVLRGSNVKAEFLIPDNLWTLEIDLGQISQVIQNIVINTDQAMPEGGVVRISAENVEIEHESGLPLSQGQYVKVTIKDEGCGIHPKCLQKIFDPYFTTKPKGSGLGLTVVYSIIKQHDGGINVESALGVGTATHIYLPVCEEKIKLEVDKHPTERIFTGKGKILLMDDEPMLLVSSARIMQTFGYQVETAEDGLKAMELYKKAKEDGHPFDLVILDLTIPGGMGGKETIQKLIQYDPAVNAVVSSGYSNDPIMANPKDYGFKGVIIKPCNMDELSFALKGFLSNEKE